MVKEYVVDLETIYKVFNENAKVDLIPKYCESIDKQIIQQMPKELLRETTFVLTGRAPVWLYLVVAHYLHGKVYKLSYDDGKGLRVKIFDHTP